MILIRLIVSLVLWLPVSSWAAIAFVANTDSADTKNVISVTTSVTVQAGTDRVLIYCSQVRNNASTAHALSTVEFGSQSLIRGRGPDTRVAADGTIQTELWYLVAPTVTTANVVATYAGANSQAIGGTATQFAGVSQASPIDSSAGSFGTGTAVAATITTIADNAAIIDCAHGRPDAGLTVGAGQTMRTDRLIGNSATPLINDGAGVSTVVTKTPAGAEVMNWTQAEAFQWAISTISLTPSGGSDPAPVVPSQVTLAWTNGTDPGSPASGIASTTIRRCTGTSCVVATTGPGIGSVAFPLAAFTDTTVSTNTSYGYGVFHTDGAGLAGPNSNTARITTSATPPPTPPTIASVAYDNTGVTITPGAVTPTKVRIWTFTSQGVITDVTVTWASLTAGRYNRTWDDGLQGSCVSAIGPTDLENRADGAYHCVNLFNLGLVLALDITPPTLICPTPLNLPAGTISWTFSCDVDKPNTGARFETSDTTYALMGNNMAANSLTFSGTVAGLTNNSTTTRYVRGTTFHPFELDANDAPVNYPNTTSYAVVINVAAAPGDVTPPGDVASLIGSVAGNTGTLSWAAATDAVSYQVYQSTDNVTFTQAGNPVAITSTQFSLSFATTYYWKIKAYDVVNNLSVGFSNTMTLTTPAAPDVERPSDMGALTIESFTNTVRLTWPLGTDNSGRAFGNIESCAVATGQSDCANFSALVGEISQTFTPPLNLTPGSRHCFRGKLSDPTGNVSLNYNTTVCVTTPTSGIPGPRAPLGFDVNRGTGSRSVTPSPRTVNP